MILVSKSTNAFKTQLDNKPVHQNISESRYSLIAVVFP